MVLNTLCIFFEMRLAFFFLSVCIFSITPKYTKTICVDKTIFLSLLILTNLVSVCSTDNCLGFFLGGWEKSLWVCVALIDGSLNYLNLLKLLHTYYVHALYFLVKI